MTVREPRLRAIEQMLRLLPGSMSRAERALERLNNGTLLDEDLDHLAIEAELANGASTLVAFAMPYKRVRAAGHDVPFRWYPADVFGYLLSFGPAEEPEPYLLERVEQGTEPYEAE